MCFASACARTVSQSSLVDALAAPGDDLEFWQQLETQRVISNNDGLHGLFLLADGVDPHADYAGRVHAAAQRGWVDSDDDLPANQSARVGMIAMAVCDILEVKGGLTMLVFGPSRRYCTRELVYLQILPPRSDGQALTGLEFLNLVGRVEDRLAGNNNKLAGAS